ncbi:pentapeptide repeat-containing protein [Actinomadura barringtoniae]|uniref:Pentapeptide repeat-containing protein n=1 Tax=Actinomadura barringtoniae TaxID=1427535 RepID=A0A939T459_9ACTN|nr:pentapeptide repeat-containing protein [Actinomadura barringtoniae]MBO2449093.1 pentapeptide repeat-containing protein [Actinomadura barringtoniae]
MTPRQHLSSQHHRPTLIEVSWPRCSVVYGCTGRAMEPFKGCAAHLRPEELSRVTRALRPGADLDLRGVTVPADLLAALLDAVTGPDRRPHLGRTRFDGAVLPPKSSLRGACFEGDSSFDGTCFMGSVSFFDVRFLGHVSFRGVRFAGNASFHGARFQRHASLDETVFAGDALFSEARWGADASFARAVFFGAAAFDRADFGRDAELQAACFGGAVSFRRVRVSRHARFERARFRHDLWLGPMAVGGRLCLTDVVAHGGLRVHAAARHVTARGATVRGAAEFRLRRAELDLEGLEVEGPMTIRTLAQPIPGVREPETTDGEATTVRLVSLHHTTAASLELEDVDLTRCRFLGLELRQADRLRLSGCCTFSTSAGSRWRRGGRGGRAILAEDAEDAEDVAPGSDDRERARELAVLYQRLAFATDGGLSRDFRYCALEIRRRTEEDQWRRLLLQLAWLTCGYGQRAGRTVASMAVLAVIVGGLIVYGGVSLPGRMHRPVTVHPHGRQHRAANRHPGSPNPTPSHGHER